MQLTDEEVRRSSAYLQTPQVGEKAEMAIQEIALTTSKQSGISLVDRLHGLVVTVDHKKRADVIGTASRFLVVAGLMLWLFACSLPYRNNTLLELKSSTVLTMQNAMVLSVGMPIIRGTRQLSRAADDRHARHGVPRLNAFGYWMFVFWSIAALLLLLRRTGTQRHGFAPDVGWFAYAPLTDVPFRVVIAPTMDSKPAADECLEARVGHQRHRDCSNNALSWADADAHALFVWDDDRHELHDYSWRCPHFGSADHVAWFDRLPRRSLLRYAIRRFGCAMAALLLDLRSPEVYILIIPGFACMSEIVQSSRANLFFGYPIMVAATTMIADYQFRCVGTHMFAVGYDVGRQHVFCHLNDARGVSDRDQIFNWLGTMYGGKIRLEVPMIFCLGFLFQFLIAGLTWSDAGRCSFQFGSFKISYFVVRGTFITF